MIEVEGRKNNIKAVAFFVVCAVIVCTFCFTSLSDAKFNSTISGSSSGIVAKPAFTVEFEDFTADSPLLIPEGSSEYYKFLVSNRLKGENKFSETTMVYSIKLKFSNPAIVSGANLTLEYLVSTEIVDGVEIRNYAAVASGKYDADTGYYTFAEATPDIMIFAPSDSEIKQNFRIKLEGVSAGSTTMYISAEAVQVD